MDLNTQSQESKTDVDILSFDGGGSRGIMEVSILSDVMRLATIVWRDPEKLVYLTERGVKVLEDPEIRKKLVNDLAGVNSPLHPTKIYDMIVGTSTGALIAFGLVGGKTNEKEERVPMTLEECIDMYLKQTKHIFAKSWRHWIISHLPGLGGIPLTTYSKDNVKGVVLEKFGKSILADFGKGNTINCVAGAVAKQIGQKEELVLFDTSTEDHKFYKTYKVLQASSNAPVYFDTPIKIGHNEFVDGGVGGNCPLAQAIPRAKEIYGDKAVRSALSIAPPSPKESHIPNRFQISYWLNYFVQQSTDGYAVYQDVKRQNKSMINFQRLSPRGERLKDFKLDEVHAKKMLEAMDDEKLGNANGMFLVDVIATAMVVVDTYSGKAKESPKMSTVKMAAQLAQIMGNIYRASKSEYELAISSYNTSISLWKKVTNEDAKAVIAEIYDSIAQCLIKQGEYQQAIKILKLSIECWMDISNKSNNIAKALLNFAECLLSVFNYNEAQKNFELVLKMEQSMYGEDATNPEVARALDNIGWCQQNQGHLSEAFKSYEDALEMKRKLYSSDSHLDIAETINNLGMYFSDQGKHDEAVKYVQDSLKMRKGLVEEENHLLIAESLNNLGWCLIESKKFAEAHKNLKHALDMAYKLFGKTNNPITAAILENFAKCLLHEDCGNNDAVEYVEEALIMKKTFLHGSADNGGIAKTLHIIGLCSMKAGKYQEATTSFQRSAKITKCVFGHTHPTLVEILSNIGESLVHQRKFQDAKTCFEEANAIKHENSILKSIVTKQLASIVEKLKQ